MKILVIGQSIIDRFEGEKNKLPKPGGVYYSTLGLLSAANSSDDIYLLTSLNKKSIQLFEKLYLKVNLDFSMITESLPEVILKTAGEGERSEEYKNISGQLDIEKVNDWNSFDGILINMITGFDITLQQLQTIRKKFGGLIYLDVHTLARGVTSDMKREFRSVPDANLWMQNVDIIQANESEVKMLVQSQSESECARNILDNGPLLLIVTRGDKGAEVYYKNNDRVESVMMKSKKVGTANKVGCGDIFGAVFFYSYISTRDIIFSLNRANKAGAIAASTKNLTELSKLDLND